MQILWRKSKSLSLLELEYKYFGSEVAEILVGFGRRIKREALLLLTREVCLNNQGNGCVSVFVDVVLRTTPPLTTRQS